MFHFNEAFDKDVEGRRFPNPCFKPIVFLRLSSKGRRIVTIAIALSTIPWNVFSISKWKMPLAEIEQERLIISLDYSVSIFTGFPLCLTRSILMKYLNEVSLEVSSWCILMKYLNGVSSWSILMKYLHEVSSWCILMKYLHEVSSWCILMKYLNEVSSWSILMKYLNEVSLEVSSWCILMKYLNGVSSWCILMKYLHEVS